MMFPWAPLQLTLAGAAYHLSVGSAISGSKLAPISDGRDSKDNWSSLVDRRATDHVRDRVNKLRAEKKRITQIRIASHLCPSKVNMYVPGVQAGRLVYDDGYKSHWV